MTFDAPMTFAEALKIARAKNLLPTNMGSAELRLLEAELRRRSVFSAKMDRAEVLRVLKKQIELIVSGTRDNFGRLRSIAEAKAQLKEAMRAAGIPPAEDGTPALQDFYSDKRRQLIVETSVLDTMNHGRWKATQDPIALDINPAWELVRMVQPSTGQARDWNTRWDLALRASGKKEGATASLDGRLVALKNHPIWQALGNGAGGYQDTLSNPWPPFAFNSGMNVIDVGREDAESLGLITATERISPQADPGYMAENVRSGYRAERLQVLCNALQTRNHSRPFASIRGSKKSEAA